MAIMNFLPCLYLLGLVYKVYAVHAAVFWEILSHPVVFGESVTLYCNTSSVQDACELEQCTRRWYGGKIQNLLSSNGLTVDKSKYEMHEDSNGFSLIIKHFNEEDANISYSCTYGFYDDKKILQLPNDFEIQPVNETTYIRQYVDSGSILNIQVGFKKVHPAPSCSIFLNGENVSSMLIKQQLKGGIFYRVTLNFQHNLEPNNCMGKIQLECTIGTRNGTVVSRNLSTFCSENSVKNESTEILKIGIEEVGHALFLCLLVVIIIMTRTCIRRFPCIKETIKAYSCMEIEQKVNQPRNQMRMSIIKQKAEKEKETTVCMYTPEPCSSEQIEPKIPEEERKMLNKDKETSEL